jgi:hypothetical protein
MFRSPQRRLPLAANLKLRSRLRLFGRLNSGAARIPRAFLVWSPARDRTSDGGEWLRAFSKRRAPGAQSTAMICPRSEQGFPANPARPSLRTLRHSDRSRRRRHELTVREITDLQRDRVCAHHAYTSTSSATSCRSQTSGAVKPANDWATRISCGASPIAPTTTSAYCQYRRCRRHPAAGRRSHTDVAAERPSVCFAVFRSL